MGLRERKLFSVAVFKAMFRYLLFCTVTAKGVVSSSLANRIKRENSRCSWFDTCCSLLPPRFPYAGKEVEGKEDRRPPPAHYPVKSRKGLLLAVV